MGNISKLLGDPNQLLVLLLPIDPSPTWDPTQPAHKEMDPRAASYVAAGLGSQPMGYFSCPTSLPEGTQLAQLTPMSPQPTAAQMAKGNWPPATGTNGDAPGLYPGKIVNGAVVLDQGSTAMNILPPPLQQLTAGEYVAPADGQEGPLLPGVVALFVTEAVADTYTLGAAGQPNFKPQATQQAECDLFTRLDAFLAKQGA